MFLVHRYFGSMEVEERNNDEKSLGLQVDNNDGLVK